jgi:hypothetical protein
VPAHLPAEGRPVPVSTYRVQLRPPAADHPGFGFADAASVVPYLADLGVTHLYCSPWLQAAPGSAHGYDVVDHGRLNDELGGEQAFAGLVDACRRHGLGIVLDVVPNHMAVSEPESQNAAWWSLLREGPDSRTLFLLAFAQLTEADYSLIRRLIDTRDIDAMALLCRAAGFDRALFVTLSLLVVSDDKGRVNLEEFGKLYERVPVSTAQRAVRFWKVRAAA